MLVPSVAWIEERPKRATSEDVSNPSPNSIPKGYLETAERSRLMGLPDSEVRYIFQGLEDKAHHISMVNPHNKPVDELEHLFENGKETACTLDLPSFLLLTFSQAQYLFQLHNQPVQDVGICKAKDDQEGRAHRASDDPTDVAECIKLRCHGRRRGSYHDASDDHNTMDAL